jgi:hypothetical protein
MTGTSQLHRGWLIGSVLMLLGAWGALIPFVGPYFGYAYTPDKAWAYTSGRLWLSIAPGAAAFLGGLLIVTSARATAAGGILAALGGAWFVLGQSVIPVAITSGSISTGSAITSTGSAFGPATMRLLEGLGFFYGLGVVVLFLAALVVGKAAAARATEAVRARLADALDREDEYGAAY